MPGVSTRECTEGTTEGRFTVWVVHCVWAWTHVTEELGKLGQVRVGREEEGGVELDEQHLCNTHTACM